MHCSWYPEEVTQCRPMQWQINFSDQLSPTIFLCLKSYFYCFHMKWFVFKTILLANSVLNSLMVQVSTIQLRDPLLRRLHHRLRTLYSHSSDQRNRVGKRIYTYLLLQSTFRRFRKGLVYRGRKMVLLLEEKRKKISRFDLKRWYLEVCIAVPWLRGYEKTMRFISR